MELAKSVGTWMRLFVFASVGFWGAFAALPDAEAQTTRPRKRRVIRRPVKRPAPTQIAPTPTPSAPGAAAEAATADDDDPNTLGEDLPEIEENDFSNAPLYKKGQSSLMAVGGVSFPNQEEAAPRLIYGAEYYYRFRHNLTFGISALYASEVTRDELGQFKFNVGYVGLAALYDAPEQFLPGMHIGPAFYLVHVDYLSQTFAEAGASTGPTASSAGLTIAIGPKVGFKFPLFWKISSQIETAVLYSPPVKSVGSFVTVNFTSGIRYDF